MIQKFLLFLNREVNGMNARSIVRAGKLTWNYYSSRRTLSRKYLLRPYYFPYLVYQQRIYNFNLTKRIIRLKLESFMEKPVNSEFSDVGTIGYHLPNRYEIMRNSVSNGMNVREMAASAWESVRVEGPLQESLLPTLSNIWKKLKQAEWLTAVSQWAITYVNLYHKALQGLIEGHREVTKDHSTVLEDGLTVEEKLKKFEESLKSPKDLFSNKK